MSHTDNEFVDHLREVFCEFGPINTRRMFGGFGIYHDNLMFGLVADDVLYLKADDASSHHFSSRRLVPFEFGRNGKIMKMSYFLAPEEIYDDPSVARQWAILAFEAALRNKKKGAKKSRKSRES